MCSKDGSWDYDRLYHMTDGKFIFNDNFEFMHRCLKRIIIFADTKLHIMKSKKRIVL